jgi:hypothetical protein
MQTALLQLALPLLVGPITFAIMQGLKNLDATVDGLGAWPKRAAVAGIAVLLTFGAKAAGVPLSCDINADVNCLAALDQDTVKALVGAALAYALHFVKPKKA